jgi:subtilisin family serine protease
VSPRRDLDFELFKGCSFDLPDNATAMDVSAAIDYISRMPAVKHIWPNEARAIRKSSASQAIIAGRDTAAASPSSGLNARQAAAQDTWSTHVMTQVDRLRAEGITGKGVKVAVVDSGIDFHHPSLGGCFGPGCLVSYGYDYIANQTEPSDCYGHGSHVAGILAAQNNNPYNLSGVAPGVTLGVYRIAGCQNSYDLDVALQALNQAYEDGSDIISLSGAEPYGYHWSEDPFAVAVERIAGKGVICVVAAGNKGEAGLFPAYEGAPSSAHGVISVGSVFNDVVPQNLTLSSWTLDSASNTTTETFLWQVGLPSMDIVPWAGTFPLYAVSRDSNVTDDACLPLPNNTPDLKDYVVLVRLSHVCDYSNNTIPNLADKNAQRIMFYGPDEM